MQAGQIEGLADGGIHDQLILNGVHQTHGVIVVSEEHHVAVNFVGEHIGSVPGAQAADGLHLILCPHLADGVVRIAEDDCLDAVLQRLLKSRQIHAVMTVLLIHGQIHQRAAGVAHHGKEGVIDRGEHRDLIAGGSDGLDGEADHGDDADAAQHLVGRELPVVAALIPGT